MLLSEDVLTIQDLCSAPLASTPVWAREFNSSEELITEFCRECRIVRKGNSAYHLCCRYQIIAPC